LSAIFFTEISLNLNRRKNRRKGRKGRKGIEGMRGNVGMEWSREW
jgi:hypothetical protein